ncbi:MAG: hypothetical protein EOO73_15495 [Myxococcales bacterium]|nr:MAG: hypothetical protein EOO73_15495 [Myxococcales bacterium]
MKVSFNLNRFASFALPMTCLALSASVAACSDDDGGIDDPVAGAGGAAGKGGSSSGGSGGKGGSGGASSDGGTDSEGGTDVGGKGGSAGSGLGGAGGEGAAPAEGGAGGEGAAGGEGPGPVPFHSAKINGPDGTLVKQVNDLRGVTFASNGKIWAVGHVGANTAYPGGVDRQVAVVRFNADGSLDSTFDGDGVKTWNLRTRQGVDDQLTNDGDEYCMGVKELPSGDVAILCNRRDAAGKGRDAVLLKMSPSGNLINWSNAAGAVRVVDFGWTDVQNAAYPGAPAAQPTDEGGGMDLTPDGKQIVVFGHGPAKLGELTAGDAPVQRTDNDRYVVKVNVTDGAPDPTFNEGKPYTFNSMGVLGDNSRRGYVQPDGSIVSAGYTNITDKGNHIVVLRLSPTGTPDADFTYGAPSIPGVFVANPFLTSTDKGVAECYAAQRQSSGRYVTTGYGSVVSTNANNPDDGISDYGWDKTQMVDLVSFGFKPATGGAALDMTYGVDGTLAIQSEALNLGNTEDRGRDLVVLPDDRVVMAGRLGTSPALFVLTADGELDPTEGGELAGAGGADVSIPGAYLYQPLSGTTSHFYAIAASKDAKRIAAVTNNHADGALLAVLSLE